MRIFPKLIYIIIIFSNILVFQECCALVDENIQPNIDPAFSKIEAEILDSIKKKRIPGCAIAIVYRNQIVKIGGYGYRSLGKEDRIDADTVFQLGSVSKPIAATLASQLEYRGLLKLDAPVRQYLPGFALKGVKDPNSLKVKYVLSHTTGIPRGGFNNLIENYTPYETIVEKLQKVPVKGAVGTKYDYNNAMYSLISTISESATHQPFQKSLSMYLLQPLHMTRTTTTLEGIMNTSNHAMPHTVTKKRLIPLETYSSGYYTVAPAGGINSTARDMANFLRAQMGGYPEVLSPSMLQRIQTPQIATKSMLHSQSSKEFPIKNSYYGLGWRITDFGEEKLIFHGGWLKGFTNFIGFLPNKQLGIIILHNGDSKFSAKTAVRFLSLVLNPKATLTDKVMDNLKPTKKLKMKKKGATNMRYTKANQKTKQKLVQKKLTRQAKAKRIQKNKLAAN